MTTKAVYAGTFDPPHNGHVEIVQKAANLPFDELVWAIGVNPKKQPMFRITERIAMLHQCLKFIKSKSKITVDSFENRFLVDYAASIGARYIIRGLRNARDFDVELEYYDFNREWHPEIETIPLFTSSRNLSSSTIKELTGPQGWQERVRKLVPPCVFEQLECVGNP